MQHRAPGSHDPPFNTAQQAGRQREVAAGLDDLVRAERRLVVEGTREEDVRLQCAVEGLQERRGGAHVHEPMTVYEHLPDRYSG
ncbi:hypothetical protein [Streptomyces tibetensis]|uniref:Uncharacterized protein n=1 Tax=Streptomyces tibetensis TaxID=2382123 RepID=A0ABW6MW98_9ACTN